MLRIEITSVCAGSGQCELFCPEVFELVGGVGRVRIAEAPDAWSDEVLAAVDACPTQAIRVEPL